MINPMVYAAGSVLVVRCGKCLNQVARLKSEVTVKEIVNLKHDCEKDDERGN